MKRSKQLAILIGIAAAFLLFDLVIWQLITRRYIDLRSEEMKGRSIEVSAYLPFAEDSRIFHSGTDFRLTDALSGDAADTGAAGMDAADQRLPRIDGAAALLPVFASIVDAIYPEESVTFDGTDFDAGSALQYSNTRGAYQAVVDGSVDVIFCAKPSAGQLQYAADQGVSLELVPIGCEAFVFVVNKDNPVENLTAEQIRGIYSGKYRRWSEVGGDDSYIDAVQRNTGSGSQTTMLSFMNGEKMVRSPIGALVGRSIGYSFRYYTDGINGNEKVKMLAIDGIYPDVEHISNGEYPLASNFYAVYDSSNENPYIQPLLEFILSEDGQEIIRESGYVPLRQTDD